MFEVNDGSQSTREETIPDVMGSKMRPMLPTEPPSPGVATRPATIDDVVNRMKEIDAALPANDGVGHFNRLYLNMTDAVRDAARSAVFEDAPFLERLDVVFAIRYFDAFQQHGTPAESHAWEALFDARAQPNIAPLQYALAGMNAHINFDLALALVATAEERGVELASSSAQHRDHLRINDILARVEDKVKASFLTGGALANLDAAAGRVDDEVALWSTARARDAAWVSAEMLWKLRSFPAVAANYIVTLDRFVGFAGRHMLLPFVIA